MDVRLLCPSSRNSFPAFLGAIRSPRSRLPLDPVHRKAKHSPYQEGYPSFKQARGCQRQLSLAIPSCKSCRKSCGNSPAPCTHQIRTARLAPAMANPPIVPPSSWSLQILQSPELGRFNRLDLVAVRSPIIGAFPSLAHELRKAFPRASAAGSLAANDLREEVTSVRRKKPTPGPQPGGGPRPTPNPPVPGPTPTPGPAR